MRLPFGHGSSSSGSLYPQPKPAVLAASWSALCGREDHRRQLMHSVQGGADEAAGRAAYSVADASSQENTRKNRSASPLVTKDTRCQYWMLMSGRENSYTDILPYDRTRLRGSQFVNASLVRARRPAAGEAPRHWIASQGPLESTVGSFWTIFFDAPTSSALPNPGLKPPTVIVQLTPLRERHQQKCSAYFPAAGEVLDLPGGYRVRRDGERRDKPDWREQDLLVSHEGGEERRVLHLEYRGWGDHGVPADPAPLLHFVRHVNSLAATTPDQPVLIHCSAGVGRTGTFIAISELLPSAESQVPVEAEPEDALVPIGPISGDEVVKLVDRLREQRVLMVQTQGQLAFIYTVLNAAAVEKHKK